MHVNLKTLTQLTGIFLAAYALKSFYSTSTVDELRWILAPTTLLVEFISGERFTFESHTGYMNADHSFLIAASCSGVNFLMISFLLLTLGKLWRESEMRWIFIPIAALAAYSTTVIANTVRIAIAMQMHANNFQLGGLDSEELHRIEGIVVYFGSLLLLFIASEIFARSPVSQLARRSIIPLSVYYIVTLGVPALGGAYSDAGFWRHAVVVGLAPLILILPLIVLSIANSRNVDELA